MNLNKLYSFVILGMLVCVPASFAHAAGGLFGSIEFKAQSLDALPKWRHVLQRIAIEESGYLACEKDPMLCETDGMLAWRHFIAEMKGKEGVSFDEVLEEVNLFINQWAYITDSENWQKRDYWATPLEFTDRSGDCEDYAVIKYVTLKELGVLPENLRIVVVKDTVREIDHAVLAVYNDSGEPYILDSLIDAVLSHRALLQYTPYYSVNETTRWAHISPVYK